MEHQTPMTTHTDYNLTGAILLYTNGEQVIATVGSSSSDHDRRLTSGKLLSKQDLADVVASMDGEVGPKWLDISCHSSGAGGGGLLYQGGDSYGLKAGDRIWWRPATKERICWMEDGKLHRQSVYLPPLIWRYKNPSTTKELYVGAISQAPCVIDQWNPFDWSIHPLRLPDLSGFRVHTCGMRLRTNHATTESVEEQFFGAAFSKRPPLYFERGKFDEGIHPVGEHVGWYDDIGYNLDQWYATDVTDT